MSIKAIIYKSLATQSTRKLKIISEGIKNITGQYKYPSTKDSIKNKLSNIK
jgi:hypothetical protein